MCYTNFDDKISFSLLNYQSIGFRYQFNVCWVGGWAGEGEGPFSESGSDTNPIQKFNQTASNLQHKNLFEISPIRRWLTWLIEFWFPGISSMKLVETGGATMAATCWRLIQLQKKARKVNYLFNFFSNKFLLIYELHLPIACEDVIDRVQTKNDADDARRPKLAINNSAIHFFSSDFSSIFPSIRPVFLAFSLTAGIRNSPQRTNIEISYSGVWQRREIKLLGEGKEKNLATLQSSERINPIDY